MTLPATPRNLARLTTGGAKQYYHYDGVGSVSAVYKYEAFGSQRGTPPGIASDYRFAGEQRDWSPP